MERQNQRNSGWNERDRREYLRILGSGGQAKIFLVRVGDKLLASKESEKTELLSRESDFLRRADSDRFAEFEDFYIANGKGFLLMEFLPGDNLGKLLCEKGIPDYEESMRILIGAAEGIAWLHSMKEPVMHRDIKPENIMITSQKEVKIIDLGCACYAKKAGTAAVGTKGYAPREQMEASGQGLYSDVYAFGKMMHYLLTGDDPRLPPPIKPGIRSYNRLFGKNLADLTAACVREKAENRPPDMRYVLHELKKIAEKKGIWMKKGEMKEIYRREFIYEKNVLMK